MLDLQITLTEINKKKHNVIDFDDPLIELKEVLIATIT